MKRALVLAGICAFFWLLVLICVEFIQLGPVSPEIVTENVLHTHLAELVAVPGLMLALIVLLVWLRRLWRWATGPAEPRPGARP